MKKMSFALIIILVMTIFIPTTSFAQMPITVKVDGQSENSTIMVNTPAKALTVESNISMSNEAGNPTVNDSITTITLKFSEQLDPKTISEQIKLYKMDSKGNPIEEPCLVKIDPDNTAVLNINNMEVDKFVEGEEYKIVISRNLKSSLGLALEKDFVGYFATNYTASLSGVADLKDTRSQIVVISDLHLGVDDSFAELKANRQVIVDFLNQIKNSPNVKQLVIAGDLIDEWFLPMNYVMPNSESAFVDLVAANNKTVIDAFNAIIKAGDIKVTYVPGNHDILVTEADIQRILPGISQARDNVQGSGTYITGDNSEIAIEHGHRYNLFCAPDPISNRSITNNNTSVLPAGYFFTRIATSSVVEGHPASSNTFPNVTDNPNDVSQHQYYLYSRIWKALLTYLPVTEKFSDKVIKTKIDGYTKDYAINDIIPKQNSIDGTIGVNLYKEMLATWGERQTINGVKVKIPLSDAIIKANESSFTDAQAQNQYFNVDGSKRIVVFGHSHVAQLAPLYNLNGKKTIYANDGTWIDKGLGSPTMTFVVITPPKSGSAAEFVNLYKYSPNKTITQWKEAQAITSW